MASVVYFAITSVFLSAKLLSELKTLFYSTKYSVKGLDLVERDLVSDFEIVALVALVEFCYFVTLTLPLEVWEYITLS